MKIIYPYQNRVAVLTPNPRSSRSVTEIAERSIPEGVPFLVVEDTDLPADLSWLDAWTADFSNPDGYGKER